MFYHIFLSPQVKRCAIITYKHGICYLLNELPNDLRLKILRKYEISGNCLNYTEWQPSAQSPHQNKYSANTRRKPPETRNQTFPAARYPTRKPELVSDILSYCRTHLQIVIWKMLQKQLICNFIEIALRHGCSPVNLLHIFKTPFPKNTSGRLLLNAW